MQPENDRITTRPPSHGEQQAAAHNAKCGEPGWNTGLSLLYFPLTREKWDGSGKPAA